MSQKFKSLHFVGAGGIGMSALAQMSAAQALGADPAAITAVRLTRLPGCLRYGVGEGNYHRPYLTAEGQPAPRMQRLLYLHPQADHTPIIDRVTQ